MSSIKSQCARSVFWRECKGVEPSARIEGCTPADLKSVKPTGTHPLPRQSLSSMLKRKRFEFVYNDGDQKKRAVNSTALQFFSESFR